MKLLLGLTFVLVFYRLQADTQPEIKMLHDSAYTLLISDSNAAMLLGKKTEKMSKKEGLIWEEANSLFIQAWLHEDKHESGKAFILYLKAIEILRPVSKGEREADLISVLLSNIGHLLTEHRAMLQAHQFLDEGIKITSQHELPSRLSDLYLNKARAFRLAQKASLAYENTILALDFAKKSGKKEFILGCLNFKGLAEIDLKLLSESIETFQSIIELASNSHIHKSGRAWHNIGFAHMEKGDYRLAEISYRKALKIEENSLRKSDKYITLLDLCEMFNKIGSAENALEFGLEAQEIYHLVEVKPENYILFDFLSQVYFEKGKFDLSRKYAKRYIEENKKFLEVQESLMQTKNQYQMELLTAGFFTQQNANRKESLYLTLLSVVTSIFTLILIAGITRQYYKRRAIKRSLIDLDLNL